MKAMTVRLDDDAAIDLEAAARADGIPMNEVIRVSVAAHIRSLRQDPTWRQRHCQLVRVLKDLSSAAQLPSPKEGPDDHA